MSFTESIKHADIPEVERPFVPSRIWWRHGVKAAKMPGFFYTSTLEFPARPSPEFTSANIYDNEAGWTAEMVHFAILAVRTQPFKRIESAAGVRIEWYDRYEAGSGMQLYTEVLALIKGCEEPVVWAVKGLTGAAVSGRGGIIKTYEQSILRAAERAAQRALPFWSFWVPIRTAMRDGKVEYRDTGYGSLVTPPAIAYPEKPISELLDEYYVGNDVLQSGFVWMDRMRGWARARRTNELPDEAGTPMLPPPNGAYVTRSEVEEL